MLDGYTMGTGVATATACSKAHRIPSETIWTTPELAVSKCRLWILCKTVSGWDQRKLENLEQTMVTITTASETCESDKTTFSEPNTG